VVSGGRSHGVGAGSQWHRQSHAACDPLAACALTARLPKRILDCRAVSREFTFSSKELMEDFRLEQRIFLQGALIEGG
jgi:hypothetical protein